MRIPKVALILLIAVLIVGFAVYLHSTRPESNPKSFTVATQSPIFQNATSTTPDANWGEAKNDTEETTYGNLSGTAVTGQVTASEPSLGYSLVTPEVLLNAGYTEDVNLAAGGPTGSVSGYKKVDTNGMTQIVTLSYNVVGPITSGPNEPIQFTCPCKIDVKVFVSDPFKNEK